MKPDTPDRLKDRPAFASERFECSCGTVKFYSKSHAKRIKKPYRCAHCVNKGNTYWKGSE